MSNSSEKVFPKTKIFIAYSRIDKTYCKELCNMLNILKQDGYADFFYDGQISPGEEWELEIRHNFEQANIILLLISPDFFNSNFILEKELPAAIHRHNAGTAKVIPIYVRTTTDYSCVASIQCLMKDKPIKDWDDHDKAWFVVVEEIKKIIDELPNTSNNNTRDFLSADEIIMELKKNITDARKVWLFSRTGRGWHHNLKKELNKLFTDTSSKDKSQLLLQNPDSKSFKFDTWHAWTPQTTVIAYDDNWANDPSSRQDDTTHFYSHMHYSFRNKLSLKVTNIMVLNALWIIFPKDQSNKCTMYIEIPKTRSNYHGNIYLSITPEEEDIFNDYLKFFQSTWKQAHKFSATP